VNERRKPSSPDLPTIGRSASSPELPAAGRNASNAELPAVGRKPSSQDLPAIGRRASSPEVGAIVGRSADGERISSPKVPRILLVDDSPAILSFIKAYLVRLGCEFVEATDGHRAIRVASLMLVDLIIADINMPGMNGIEMVASLRQGDNPRLQKIPIILMTGDKSPDLEKRGRAAGTSEFILKPVDGAELSRTVERLLRPST